ncbi:MAG: pyridoxamine 5'-phosphate oxidase family protein [Rudaea sp.]
MIEPEQSSEQQSEGRVATVDELRRHVLEIEFCMLTTHDGRGDISSRPLQTMDMQDDATLWFFTSRDSAKVHEIGRDARVCVSYADAARRFFVQLSGEASIIDDRERAAALWQPAQRIFFPQGPLDPALVLIRFVTRTATVWDGNESLVGKMRKFGDALLHHQASNLGTVNEIDLRDRDAAGSCGGKQAQ